MRPGLGISAALVLVLAAQATAAQPLGKIDIAVSGVRDNAGRVHVDICPEKLFLTSKCPYSASAPAHAGTTIVTISNLPAGTYAAQVFHDENGNGKVDRALFGIPIEGVGFSNDAPIKLSAPKYEVAKFDFTKSGQTIRLKLQYFFSRSR